MALVSVLVGLWVAVSSQTALAHYCGVSYIQVMEGRQFPYEITGAQVANFRVTGAGDTSIATVWPEEIWVTNNGQFSITGVSPGTVDFTFLWENSNTTNDNGECWLRVQVDPDPESITVPPPNPLDGRR